MAQSRSVAGTLLGFVVSLAAGCGGATSTEGLNVEASFASGVPRSARDEAVRVEGYLLDSCDSVEVPERPNDAIGSTFMLRDGIEGPPIAAPDPGEYGLYAVALDSNCAVVAAGCDTVTIVADSQAILTVTMGAFSGGGCSAGEQCSIGTGDCLGPDGGSGGAGGTGGTGGGGGAGGTGGTGGGGGAGGTDCVDADDDGYCVDTDCDDSVPTCNLDCTTNSDGGDHVDCFETFCGTDPNDNGSECREVRSEAEFHAAIEAANANAGPDYIVLHDITITDSNPPKIEDDAGLTIQQVAGATLTVDSDTNRTVFKLESTNNLIDGVHVVNVSNAHHIIEIKADDNIVRNCQIEGFNKRGIYIDGGPSADRGANAQVLNNVITGGLDVQGNESGGIIVRNAFGAVVAGNTVALNTMDGVQIRNATAPFIDHNTIANNGGSGLDFYGDPSSDVCLRNNNVTDNAELGLDASVAVSFDATSACTGPLTSGPAYGNNDFNNAGGSCGGSECTECACLPPGSFWQYNDDPLYSSITVGDPGLYCLGASSTLIDGGDDLLAYDLNGAAPGNFNESSPDIGSREDGPSNCD
jgi:parallel beta-helix repeat protein